MSAARFTQTLADEMPEVLTLRGAVAVLTLAESGGIGFTSAELAERIGVSRPVMCRIMNALEVLEFARRRPGPTYRKRCMIELLPHGRAFADRISAALPPTLSQRGKVSA